MRPIRERRLWARKRPTVPGEPRSDGDRQKPPPTLLFGQAPPRQPLPVESAGNASAKAMPARRCPNAMEHKGARARQSRARKLAVQTCRGCKLRLLRRISFIASWRTALWCRRWRQSVVSAESGAVPRYLERPEDRGSLGNGGATILISPPNAVAAVGATREARPPPAYRTVDGVWPSMWDRGRAVCAGQAHHVA